MRYVQVASRIASVGSVAFGLDHIYQSNPMMKANMIMSTYLASPLVGDDHLEAFFSATSISFNRFEREGVCVDTIIAKPFPVFLVIVITVRAQKD